MIAALKPYPQMKDSGVEWLGLIPEHWETKRSKRLFQKMERPVTESDEVVTCFRDGIVTLRRNRRVCGFTELLKEIGYQGIRRGDLVIHGMDAFAGAIGVADSDGKGTPVYSVCKPGPTANAQYYAYTLREMARSRWIQALAKGIRERSTDFRFESFGSQQIPLPPLPEQAAIVRYLDHVDRRIQRYIRAKQKLIALLDEQKQAVIHQAVTGQFDVRTGRPYTAYKDSGVEWLGAVPGHWEQCRLRNVVSIVTTGSRGWSSYASDTGPLFIRVANLNRGSLQLRFDDVVRLNLPSTSEVIRSRVEAGDILVSVTAYIGSVGVAPEEFEEAYVSQHVARCQPRPGLSSQWLGYVLLSTVGQTHGQMSLYGGTKDGLSLDDVKNYPILLPSRCEQNQLVLWIERELSSLVKIEDSANREITLLREYRTRLIADVVTGKLDVRRAAANLPHKINEAEQLVDVEGLTNKTEVLDWSFLRGSTRQVCTAGDENRKTIRK
ncbi:MAG: restriction endonuclease subunit S [Bryobacterales bacterium]|nr:restriction endonuclease subunit S [Bryobacterales bacterium]